MQKMWTAKKQTIYDHRFEHDACGIAMLANIKGEKPLTIVAQA